MHNSLLKGQWFIEYPPDKYDYPAVLETLINNPNAFPTPTFPSIPDTGEIKKILLANPVLTNDKRWETIQLTTSALYLGSGLTGAGFDVKFRKLAMPSMGTDMAFNDFHLLGLTLFEDVFKDTRDLLEKITGQGFNGLLAAGGPMVTLNPLQTAHHLPRLNLLVRGEAETVLPRLLQAINDKNTDALLREKGFLFHVPGTLIISHLDTVNRPENFDEFEWNLDFFERKHLEPGLEINLSRGCGRGCVFCSHVQGRALRKLPTPKVKELLEQVSIKLEELGIDTPHARTVNINDDDILQDMDYAVEVLELLEENNYKLWGIQTSIASFFDKHHIMDQRVLDTVARRELYVDNNPLVWVGTDVFLKERGKKMGKWVPTKDYFIKLLEEFEKRGIRNYHYWISSDHDSGWPEFTKEFLFIHRLLTGFERSGLLAHSPYVVPYSSTPLYRLLTASPGHTQKIKYKMRLTAGNPVLDFPLVQRVETAYPHLNRLLDNETLNGQHGFFDSLKQKDYLNAALTLYNFLKQERLSFESINHPESGLLLNTEKDLENFISTII